jgi:hypothetical protein
VNRYFHRLLSIMCVVALGAISRPLVAQQAPQPAQPASPGVTAGSTNGQGFRGVNGFPYSADEVIVTTQNLEDGSKITIKHLVKIYQDSQGRKRFESFRPGVESVGQDDSLESVQIIDPVAGATYDLNPRKRTAQRKVLRRLTPSLHPQTTGASADVTPARPGLPRLAREDLGTQVIEGLEARGERFTRTIPAGAQGNDRPLQITSEIWSSADPPLVLLRMTSDPRHGESVMHLTNLVFEEPPAELFQVPPDYTVEELQPVANPASPSD